MYSDTSIMSHSPSDSRNAQAKNTGKRHQTWPNASPSLTTSNRISRLSLRAFCERFTLMMSIGLPCMMQLGPVPFRNGFTRIRDWFEATETGFCFLGEHFCVPLRHTEIGAVLLLTRESANQLMSIAIQDRSGNTLLTLFGANTAIDIAVWEDIMGNPCHPVDTPDFRLNKS